MKLKFILNGKCGVINSGPVFPQRLFESNLNNGPSPGDSNLVSDEVYICSSLMIFWWLPYLANLNNGSNSGCILVLQRLFQSNLNNGPSPSHSNLVSDGGIHLFRSPSYLWFSGGYHICPRTAGLTSVMAQEVTQIVAPFCPPQRLFEFDSNSGPSPGHSNLMSDEGYICSSLLLMIFWWLPCLANGPGNDLIAT